MNAHVRAVVAALLMVGGAASARAQDVRLTVEEREGTYQVRGEFKVALPVSAVWTVLADYDHIHEFVSSMRSSTLEYVEGGYLRVRQVAVAGVFPFRRTIHVLLDIREDAGSRIVFTDVLHEDFQTYAGEWTVVSGSPRDSTARTTVRYALDAQLRAGVPSMLGRPMMSRGARDLLRQVRAEIVRRARLARERRDPSALRR